MTRSIESCEICGSPVEVISMMGGNKIRRKCKECGE